MSTPAGERTLLLRPNDRAARGCWWATCWLVGSAGLGYAADGYDLFNIDLVMAIISKEYPGHMSPSGQSLTVSSCLVGVIVGQLLFGYLADSFGRRGCSLVIAALQLVGAVLSACCSEGLGVSMAGQLALCRFVLGLGVGGEYPLAAAIGVEGYSSPSYAGRICLSPLQLLAATALLYEVGMLVASVVVLVLMWLGLSLNAVWRLALAAGAMPSALALLLRLAMDDSDALERARAKEAARLAADSAETAGEDTRSRGAAAALLKTPWPMMVLAVGVAWSLNNSVLFSQGSFKSEIAEDILGAAGDVRGIVHRDALFGFGVGLAVVVATCSVVPLVDTVGCRNLAVVGFLTCSIFNIAAAVCLWSFPRKSITGLLLFLQVLAFASWGPMKVGVKCVLPVNVPATVRSRCQGLASACGKAGALVGSALFPIAEEAYGLPAALLCCAGAAAAGVAVSAAGFPVRDNDPRELDAKCG